MLTTLTILGIQVHAFHGALEVERELGQLLSIDVAVTYDLECEGDGSAKQPPVREASLYEDIKFVVMGSKYSSLELLAGSIGKHLLKRYAMIQIASITISRRQIFIPGVVEGVQVEVTLDRDDLTEV